MIPFCRMRLTSGARFLMPLLISVLCRAAPAASAWPAWLHAEGERGEMAAGACVMASGDLSIDQLRSTFSARSALASQLQARVDTYAEQVQSLSRQGKVSTTEEQFRQRSSQATGAALVGSRLTKFEPVEVAGQRMACARVTMPLRTVDGLGQGLVQAAGPRDDEMAQELARLWQRTLAQGRGVMP